MTTVNGLSDLPMVIVPKCTKDSDNFDHLR
jgi:hypothetical protein